MSLININSASFCDPNPENNHTVLENDQLNYLDTYDIYVTELVSKCHELFMELIIRKNFFQIKPFKDCYKVFFPINDINSDEFKLLINFALLYFQNIHIPLRNDDFKVIKIENLCFFEFTIIKNLEKIKGGNIKHENDELIKRLETQLETKKKKSEWNYYSREQDLDSNWDYYQPYEWINRSKKYIVNGTINHYRYITIHSEIIYEIRIHTDRTDSENNYFILCLNPLFQKQFEEIFNDLLENKILEYNKIDQNLPYIFIHAIEAESTFKALIDKGILFNIDYEFLSVFLKELDTSLSYALKCKNEITIAQKEVLNMMVEPYLEELTFIEPENFVTLIEMTSKLLLNKGIDKAKNMLPIFLKKFAKRNRKELNKLTGSTPNKTFYECLIAFVQVYSSLGNIEEALAQNGSSLPSKDLIRKLVLSFVIEKQCEHQILSLAKNNLSFFENIDINHSNAILYCNSNEKGLIIEIFSEKRKFPFWQILINNNLITWNEKKYINEINLTFENLFKYLVIEKTINLLSNKI